MACSVSLVVTRLIESRPAEAERIVHRNEDVPIDVVIGVAERDERGVVLWRIRADVAIEAELFERERIRMVETLEPQL